MSTRGMQVGGVIGAIAGYFFGPGALVGAQLGILLGGIIDPPEGQNTQGPRLEDMTVQTSTYGAPIPRVYGTVALSGNVFWLENNALKEVATTNPTETQGGKGGGSGPTTTTYAYYATFAVGLCQGPIAGIRRIWVRNQLIYDAGSSDLGTIVASNAAATNFTLHLGDDAQLPDDRMQATLGVANTPAYRGLAYLVFHDFALADYSNSLMGAQVKVEIVKNGSQSPDLRTLFNNTNSGVTFGSNGNPGGRPPAILSSELITRVIKLSGTVVYCFDSTGNYLYSDVMTIQEQNFPGDFGDGGSSYLSYPVGIIGGLPVRLGYPNVAIGVQYILYAGVKNAGLPFGDELSTPLPAGEFIGGVTVCVDGLHFVIYTSPTSATVGDDCINKWYLLSYDGSTTTLERSGTIAEARSIYSFGFGNSTNYHSGCSSLDFDLKTIVLAYENNIYHYSIGADNVFRLMSSVNISETIFSYPSVLVQNGIVTVVAGASFAMLSIGGPITKTQPALSTIVQAECLSSNLLSAGDLDVTALTKSVRGYRVTNIGTIRSALDILRGAFPFDVVQSGYQIVFKPRGGSSVATIPAADLDARNAGDSPGVSVENSREMDSVLPARVVLKYLDADLEYGDSSQYAERLNTLAINVTSIDLPMVLTATEAAGIAETLLYLYWLERNDLKFTLPATWQALEPGDVITLAATESTYSLRLTSITYTQDSRLECQAKYAASAIYTPSAQGESSRSQPTTISPPGSSALALLDIPLLIDATDTPGFPVAMCGYLASWPGGALYRTDDAGQTWTVVQGFTAPGAVIGFATTILPDGRTDLIDPTGLLNVALLQGSLSSVTESALFSGANHFAYGADGRWEIIGAKTCTQQSDGSYNLSDLLRGRQGTEWACSQHAAGDRVILLDAAALSFVRAALNSIGLARTYRAVTNGKTLDTADDVPFTYRAVNLECLSPVYANGNRNPSTNDWTLAWIRRTRVGGAWRDYVDASLGEASEAWEIDIFSSNTYATLKRTLTGLTSATATYTSAQQVTDFGSNQATLYLKIYQISANAGRGYPLTTSLTR